jgi:hypothetical protein
MRPLRLGRLKRGVSSWSNRGEVTRQTYFGIEEDRSTSWMNLLEAS